MSTPRHSKLPPGWEWPDLSIPRECRRDIRMGGGRKQAMTRVRAEQEAGPGKNAYECGVCGHWHVGHGRKRTKEQVR